MSTWECMGHSLIHGWGLQVDCAGLWTLHGKSYRPNKQSFPLGHLSRVGRMKCTH